MPEHRGRRRPRGFSSLCAIVAVTATTVSCRRAGGPAGANVAPAALRIGVGQASATNPAIGLRQLNQLLTFEGLARTSESGRMQPWLAEGWTAGNDGRTLTVRLRPNVKFHDGSSLDAATVSSILPGVLRNSIGPVYADLEGVKAISDN